MTGTALELSLNGVSVPVQADPETPLLYVLRRQLGAPAARFGCGEGFCGACTVIVDGRVTQSCDVPVGAVAGCAVETVEGLGQAHPLVAALVEGQAGQCGYCLPGIVMRATALLRDVPRPDRAQIAEALDGNLCRCGAHLRILAAIETAADRMAEDRP